MVEKQMSAPHTDDNPFHDPDPFSMTAQGHELSFYPAGGDRLDALVELIDGAQGSLRLCYYIFTDDAAGQRVRDALVAAARRGVDTRLIVDGFGSRLGNDYFGELVAAGGRFSVFSPRFGRRYLIRNHQKMAIVDRRRAMIGGFNVEQDYFSPPVANGWHDLGLIIEGPVVAELMRWFEQLEEWLAVPREQLRAIRRQVRDWKPAPGPVQLLIGGPTEGLSSWSYTIGQHLKEGSRLDMVMAYFSPSNGLMRRIARIARKGKVRLVMAGKSDNGATIGATRSLYHYLLKRGARVWEFGPTKLHMKLIVLDDTTYIGSANFDVRSLYLNMELMLRIEDAALAERMREFVENHFAYSHRITRRWQRENATFWNRLRWNLSWWLVTVLDYNVTRRLNLGL